MRLRSTTSESWTTKAVVVAVIAVGMNLMAAPAQATSSQFLTPIEIAYESAGFEGDSWIVSADRDCTGTLDDIDHALPNVDIEIGSYRTYRNCYAKHYELPNFQGRSIGWDGGSSAEVPFRVRSIQWS